MLSLKRGHLLGGLLALVMAIAACAQAIAYWPGMMSWDAVRQYGQAVDGDFDDWHPPAMAWVWRRLVPLHVGPSPMLMLQLGLYWGGFALLAAGALKQKRHGLALALTACGFLPLGFALMGSVLKDCLMTGALLSATGLLAWCRPGRDVALRTLAMLLILFTGTLRFNAFLAGVPLMVALLPSAWRRGPIRLAAISLVCAVALIAALPVANRLIGAKRSGVELSLIIFDLGGITKHSGVDLFPPLAVADPVAVNAHCYEPAKWDSYAWWVDRPCPIGFYPIQAAFQASGKSPYTVWIEAIAAHPLAYALHRLAHFNINSRFLVPDQVERPVQDQSAPTPGNFFVHPNPLLSVIDRAAVLSASTPFGWPICWMAVAIGTLILSPVLPSRALIVPIALSALLYGLGYLAVSVASDLRYHLWTISGALIAAVIAAFDARGSTIARGRWLVAAAPATFVTVLCIVWRLT